MTFRNLILNNFVWKLISVMLALLVWWRVNNLVETEESQSALPAAIPERSQTVALNLPVRVLTPARLPRGFAVVPSEVTVTLHGTAGAWEPADTTNALAYVEAILPPTVKSAKLPVVVRPPAGVTVQAINPPEVFVERL
jgi:YbbR domain-containing protein